MDASRGGLDTGGPAWGWSSASTARSRVRSVRVVQHRVSAEARFRAWSLSSEGRQNSGRLRDLRNAYLGQRAIVMGNGPSLLRADLNALSRDVTIVSNAHYLIWDRLTYVPTFLAVEDRLVVEDRAAELRDLDGVTTIFPFEFRPLLGPATAARLYVNFVRQYLGFPRFSYDVRTRVFWGGTVSFLNLQLAAYLGCRPIILIGFDHSYNVPDDDRVDSVIRSTGDDVNHIHPDYFGPGYRWHDPQIPRMEAAYECARRSLDAVGIPVFNATSGGNLEIFERMSPMIKPDHD